MTTPDLIELKESPVRRMLFIFTALACAPTYGYDEITDYGPEYSDFLIKNSIVDACQDSPRNVRGFSNAECSLYIYRRRNEALAAKELEPQSCDDQAQYDGFGAPKLNMRVSFTGGEGQVVKFEGEILQGEDSTLVVYHAATTSNAIVHYADDTRIFSEIFIGGPVTGYGRVVGRNAVTLGSGRQVQVPVIEAFCIQ